MEIILIAILAALSQLSEPLVKEGYEALKAVIWTKFEKDSEFNEALKKLEQNPNSSHPKEILKNKLKLANASKDKEIIVAALDLLVKIKKLPNGERIIEKASKLALKGEKYRLAYRGPRGPGDDPERLI